MSALREVEAVRPLRVVDERTAIALIAVDDIVAQPLVLIDWVVLVPLQ